MNHWFAGNVLEQWNSMHIVHCFTRRSTLFDVYAHDPNAMLHICWSNGKLLTSIAQWERNIQWGYQAIPPLERTTAKASLDSMSVSALPKWWQMINLVDINSRQSINLHFWNVSSHIYKFCILRQYWVLHGLSGKVIPSIHQSKMYNDSTRQIPVSVSFFWNNSSCNNYHRRLGINDTLLTYYIEEYQVSKCVLVAVALQ